MGLCNDELAGGEKFYFVNAEESGLFEGHRDGMTAGGEVGKGVAIRLELHIGKIKTEIVILAGIAAVHIGIVGVIEKKEQMWRVPVRGPGAMRFGPVSESLVMFRAGDIPDTGKIRQGGAG